MTAPAPAATRQRPEIQGLRAVAVMAVVLYHLWPGRLPGGYIGVDVFFVISGFLITGNLLREVGRTGRVSLADFWARRARRLLPAACLVLVFTAVGVAVLVPRLLWQQFFKEIGASVLYVENWSLARDAVDYLASSNAPSPVQHYWTLSAEEQFYLVWPLLVLLGLGLARLLRRDWSWGVAPLLVLATAASLAFSLWQTVENPSVAYFSTLTRAWEFGAGALLALFWGERSLRRPAVAAGASAGGLGVIAACSFVFDHDTPMPGFAAVAVVAGTVAVIAAGHPDVAWSPSRLLTWRPATWIGDISYSAYLWHWPLLVLLPYLLDRPAGFLPRVGVLVATLLAAWATKVWVEDPVRTTRRLGLRRPAVALGAAFTAAALVVSGCTAAWWSVEQDTREQAALAKTLVRDSPPCLGAESRDPRAEQCPDPRLARQLVPSVTAVADDYPDYPGCEAQLAQRPLRPCAFGDAEDDSVPHIAVIGDSHARALMPAITELVDEGLLTADLYTAGGCAWAVGDPVIADKQLKDLCLGLKRDMQPQLEARASSYDFIVTTAWTNKRLRPIRGDNAAGMAAAWKPLADRGVPIVAVRDNPSAGGAIADNPNNCLAEVDVSEANAKCSLKRRASLDRWEDPLAGAVARTKGAHLVDMTRFYCDEKTCPVQIGGVNVYRDNSHVTVTYARTMAPYYHRALARLGLLPRP